MARPFVLFSSAMVGEGARCETAFPQTDCECRPAVFFHTFYTDEGFESLGYCSTYWGTIRHAEPSMIQ